MFASFLLEPEPHHNHGHRHGLAIILRGGQEGRSRRGGRGRRTGLAGHWTGRTTSPLVVDRTTNANVVVPVYRTGRTTQTQNWTFFIAFM